MSNKKSDKTSANAAGYDPATLLSLYTLQQQYAAAGLGGLGAFAGLSGVGSAAATATSSSSSSESPSSPAASGNLGGTLGVAASQAASLGMNQASAAWWNMASQLAAQDYLVRLQAAASRDPSTYAALAQSAQLELLNQQAKNQVSAQTSSARSSPSDTASNSMLDSLRLPMDTEIIKYTSSSTGPKVPGTTNRGRKKTISLDPSPLTALLAGNGANGSASVTSSRESTPTIPAGLTIERKKPGRKPLDPDNHIPSSSSTPPMIDKVEITKVPVGSNGRSNSPAFRDFSGSKSKTNDFGNNSGFDASALNLSSRPTTAATISPVDYFAKSGKIPPEYYASQALSGVFLAEQIRQQQLAAALESRIKESGNATNSSTSTDFAQAAYLMNKLSGGEGSGNSLGRGHANSSLLGPSETSKLLAIAAAAAASAAQDKPSSGKRKSQPCKKTSGTNSNKSVAALLAASKVLQGNSASSYAGLNFSQNDSDANDYGLNKPELTIEPIFRNLKPDSTFDISNRGRRFEHDQNPQQQSNNSDPKDRLKIKTISDSPEIRNLSSDNEDNNAFNHAAGNLGAVVSDSDSEENHGARASGRYATVETAELRLPLKHGWVRETLVREYSKSGVRGDVTYYAPCGKKFKQYPDIMRYLEKNNVKQLGRSHFSFSTKIFIGEFLKPTGVNGDDGQEKYLKLNEKEMLEDVDKIRRENGWKPRKKFKETPAVVTTNPTDSKAHQNETAPALSVSPVVAEMTPEQKILARLQAEMHLREQAAKQQEELRLQKEALKYIKEAERLEKLEQARKEKELRHQQLLEAKRKKQEDLQRQKQEENLRKLKEKEEKRQQQALQREQYNSSDYGSALKANLERERRRQHLILMKQLEGKKRNDERERKKEELRIEKEKERERKSEQKKLEAEIVAEMRKPIEDMCLSDHKELPELKRIPEMVLSGEAFANILMVYEFLHNFGERLGFDMDSLPTLSDLQAAFLNDPEAEEELLSVVIHLLVCAIDDPGIPTPYKHLTLLGQTLRQADITNTNVSEILKIYLTARGQVEVKQLHGVTPPETHSSKDRNREIPFCQKKMDEFNQLLFKTRPYEMAQWVKDKPFLCLNPTEKAEILAFVCNELLFNKAVLHQIDGNVEKVNKSKKVKLIVETRLRRLKSTQHRRFKIICNSSNRSEQVTAEGDTSTNASHMDDNASEIASTIGEDKDDTMSVKSEATNDSPSKKPAPPPPPAKTKGKRGRKPKNNKATKKKKEDEEEEEKLKQQQLEEEEEEDKLTEADLKDIEEDDEDDEKLNQEELQKKIEKTSKQLLKCQEDLSFITNSLRVTDLGQDRYRRRYWHFAHAGGVFIEGMESCEPWKLAHKGMPHFKKDIPEEEDDEEEEIDDEEVEEPPEKKVKLEEEVNGDVEMTEVKEDVKDEKDALFRTPKIETKDGGKTLITPKITPNGDKLNLFNHSAHFNMSLSPVVLNGSVTITPKLDHFSTSSPVVVNHANADQNQPQQQSVHYQVVEKPWFSILSNPGNQQENQAKFEELKRERCSTPDKTKALLQSQCPVNPQIALLELRLEQMRRANFSKERKDIPEEFSRGWWRTIEPNDICELEKTLHMRGTREQQLLNNIRKNLDFCLDISQVKSTKPLGPEIVLDELEDVEDLIFFPGNAPGPDKPGKWSREVALRVDKYILEQVEALEDKVASASMQVPGWKVPNRPDIETRSFRASCEPPSGPKDDRPDPITEARERLLDLEANIERRYLKAPLGFSNAEINLQTITSSTSNRVSSTPSHSTTSTPRRTTNTSLNISRQMNEKQEEENEEKEEDEEAHNDGDNDQEMSQELNNSTESNEPEEKSHLPRGLVTWREAVRKAQTAAQLAMGFYVLETSIAWHKSIMKAFCQLCHSGDDEDSLLLCDGCDKGYHMYCFKPSMTKVPEGDWYCFECINKATGARHCLVCGKQDGKHLVPCTSCPRAYHTECLSPALSKIFMACGCFRKVPRGKWQCPGCNQKTPKKKIPKKLKIYVGTPDLEETNSNGTNHSTTSNSASNSTSTKTEEKEKEKESKSESNSKQQEEKEEEDLPAPPDPKKAKKEAKKKAKAEKDLTPCQILIMELESSDDAWPFLFPVNTKQFPTYRKIIKNPMDIATIKRKLENGNYRYREDFCEDVRLIFANCEIFNEDDSPVGKAGHAMKNLFDTRWVELIGEESGSK